MTKGRLEAFSDGVLAIVITIMVLELRPPDGATLDALAPLWPKLLSYVLSFVYLGIYWNNHHHLLHAAKTISGSVLWANLHLLFWLSLVPAGTAWIGQTGFAPIPVAFYGLLLIMPAIAYTILVQRLVGRPVRPRPSPRRSGATSRARRPSRCMPYPFRSPCSHRSSRS